MKNLLLAISMVSFTTIVSAQWNSDPTVNNPICTFSNTTAKSSVVSVTDGNNGMWIAWEDSRDNATTGTDIYCQKINANGSIAFDNQGILVCNAAGSQSALSITTDGYGGCIISWTDARTTATTNNDVYAQRINSSGSAVWTANGVVVSNGAVIEQSSVIERISATEVIVAWRDDRNDASLSTSQDYFFNKLLISDGSKVLINDVVLVSANNLQTNLRLLSDGSGNAFAIWQDPRISTQNADIYVQKINNNGTLAWTANGVNITAIATNNQSTPRIISDGVGGIIATWDDNRATNVDQDIYAQRIDKDGIIKWTAGGIAVSAVSGSNQRSPVMTTDGNSGAIIAWQDLRTSGTTNNDIYTQRIDSNGVIKWTANGVLVCNAAGSQPNSATGGFSINDDGVGGAIIVWDDARISTSDLDIFAQRVTADGNILWSTNNGVAIATKSSSNQRIPTVVKSTGNSLLIAWADSRTSTNGEIYASNLLLTGVLPVTFTNISATANSQSIVVNWQTSNEVNTKQFTVQRSADGSTFTNIGSVQANGVGGKYAFTDNAPIQGNNYYRIQSVDKDGYTQFSTIALAKNLSTTISKLRIYPNPAVNGTLQVQLNNYTLGKYFIKINDVNGRTLQQKNISILNTSTTRNIQLSSTIQTGNYVLQVVDEQGNVIESKAFIKQ